MYVCPSDFTTSLVLIRLWTLIYKSMVSGVSSLDEIYRLVSFWVNEKIAQSYVSNEIYSGNSLFHQQVPSKSCSCGNLTHPFCYFYDYFDMLFIYLYISPFKQKAMETSSILYLIIYIGSFRLIFCSEAKWYKVTMTLNTTEYTRVFTIMFLT